MSILAKGKSYSLVEGQRRLAAIMFTDVVGYTALTQSNESTAMQVLQKHNEILRPIFPNHHGKEIKTIGDAFLVEFVSALEALLCAIEIQKLLHEYNEANTNSRIQVRIGIHLGDVIYRENDVFGDAVNIASRIQPLAQPGGICVSEQVYDQVRNKIPFNLVKLENIRLKNIFFPSDVYQVALPWEPEIAQHVQEAMIPLKKRLAILPLSNITRDPQDEYFADGMTDELINVLSHIKDLRVIARTSVMRYKGSTKRISEIGRELNVGSILEGSIRKIGNKVRVTVQIIDTGTEEHVLATNYDHELHDIFTVQSDIARQVSRALKAKFRATDKEQIKKEQTENIDAYTFYLKGRFALHARSSQKIKEAIGYFEQALAKDPNYARAYAGLADSNLLMGSYGYSESKEAYVKAKEFVSKALELDDELAEAHVSLGLLLETYYFDFQGAGEEFRHAISLNPSNAQAHHWYGINLAIFNKLSEAVSEMEKAQEIDPFSAQIGTVLGGFYLYQGRKDEALMMWENALTVNPDNVPLLLNRALYFAKEAMKEQALADMAKALQLSSNAINVKCLLAYVHAILGNRGEAQKILNEVETRSRREYASPFYLAIIYAGLDDMEKCLVSIDQSIKDRSVEIESLLHDAMFESIRADPKLDVLLKEIGLSKHLIQVS